MWLYYLLGGLIVVFSIDWYYFIISYWTIFWGHVKRQKPLTDTFSINVFSSFNNTDTAFDHLNNAKYLMYMDFARMDYWSRTRLFYYLWQNKTIPLQSATIIRYMKPIKIFTPVRIDTRLVWWDDSMVYLEHKFIVKSPTERVQSISMSRVCLGRKNLEHIFKNYPSPEYPERLRPWIEALSVSSTTLLRE